jgi:SAM-dependent methyltransferase
VRDVSTKHAFFTPPKPSRVKWILKAIIQKGISFLPNSQRVNYWFQKNVTKGVQLSDQYFGDKLGHAADHLRFFKTHGHTETCKVLELGSGWYPVIPIALYLAGAEETVSIDISPLMTRESVQQTIERFLNDYEAGKLESLNPYIQPERLATLKAVCKQQLEFSELLASIHLRLEIKDARNTEFPPNYFDLVCSNNTYEHIYPHILAPIIAEFQRVLKPGGINSHFIDMSDHFAHLDQSITIYNYLRYSKRQWALIDNTVQPQNRLRLSDYKKLYQKAGIALVAEEIRPGSLQELDQVKLHADYAHYQPADIAISHAHLVSGK